MMPMPLTNSEKPAMPPNAIFITFLIRFQPPKRTLRNPIADKIVGAPMSFPKNLLDAVNHCVVNGTQTMSSNEVELRRLLPLGAMMPMIRQRTGGSRQRTLIFTSRPKAAVSPNNSVTMSAPRTHTCAAVSISASDEDAEDRQPGAKAILSEVRDARSKCVRKFHFVASRASHPTGGWCRHNSHLPKVSRQAKMPAIEHQWDDSRKLRYFHL